MKIQTVKWCVNVAMGSVFLVSLITGLIKFTLIMRVLGLTGVVLPLARISDIHDWSGLALCFFVFLHLFLNRAWIMSTTRTIFHNLISRTPP